MMWSIMGSAKKESDDLKVSEVVDTLFGPQEVARQAQEQLRIQEEQFSSYLFRGTEEHAELPLVNVEHFRSVIVEDADIAGLLPYLDELSLFEKQWGFSCENTTREEWCRLTKMEAVPILQELMTVCSEKDILEPKAIYAYCPCLSEGDKLSLLGKNGEVCLSIPFDRLPNGVCLADKVNAAAPETIGLIGVTMGKNVSETARKWRMDGHEQDYRYLRGFSLEMLKAMTEYTAAVMNKEGCCLGSVYSLGVSKEGSGKIQSALIEMLDAGQIGITFSRNYFMMPEFSALALLLPR